ncbi:MAG: hypothetical protein FJW86_12715 [Actinobacteria bacterium]|nr:hypothetical protein [Actinomycetota bacterium]
MADDLEHARKRLEDEYGQTRRRFDEIHDAFDSVAHAREDEDLYERLLKLEKKVKKVRTGGWFRPGARGHRRALKKYLAAKAAAEGPQVTKY